MTGIPREFAIGVGACATVVGVAGWLTYAALTPESQFLGRTLVAGRDPDEVALTYDDGPNDAATPRLLEILDRAGVKATFFMIGRFVRQRPNLVREVAAAGHLVGNHTMTHPWLPTKTGSFIREELRGCQEALEDTLGSAGAVLPLSAWGSATCGAARGGGAGTDAGAVEYYGEGLAANRRERDFVCSGARFAPGGAQRARFERAAA